jgi:hypothetical protein
MALRFSLPMTKEDVAALPVQLRPAETLAVSGELLDAFPSRSALCYLLDGRARANAERFGAMHNCNFHFDKLEG